MAHGRKEEKRMKWILGCSEEGELGGRGFGERLRVRDN